VRYTSWVDRVFRALARSEAASPYTAGVSLSAVGEDLGVEGLTREDFVPREGFPGGLFTAMRDLEAIGLVVFFNVGNGNQLTPLGRDVASAGLDSVWPEIATIRVDPTERAVLARLVEASRADEEDWAELVDVDADPIYRELGLETADDYLTTIQRMTFLGDLERKGLVRRSHTSDSSNSYRPTYLAAVLVEAAPGTKPATTGQTRRRGRPRGPSTLARSDIERAYRDLWERPGRRPQWTQVAQRLGVDERTLRSHRTAFGISHESITDEPE
jgi:hypothetical protein